MLCEWECDVGDVGELFVFNEAFWESFDIVAGRLK